MPGAAGRFPTSCWYCGTHRFRKCIDGQCFSGGSSARATRVTLLMAPSNVFSWNVIASAWKRFVLLQKNIYHADCRISETCPRIEQDLWSLTFPPLKQKQIIEQSWHTCLASTGWGERSLVEDGRWAAQIKIWSYIVEKCLIVPIVEKFSQRRNKSSWYATEEEAVCKFQTLPDNGDLRSWSGASFLYGNKEPVRGWNTWPCAIGNRWNSNKNI